jgi:hypothetical protein
MIPSSLKSNLNGNNSKFLIDTMLSNDNNNNTNQSIKDNNNSSELNASNCNTFDNLVKKIYFYHFYNKILQEKRDIGGNGHIEATTRDGEENQNDNDEEGKLYHKKVVFFTSFYINFQN